MHATPTSRLRVCLLLEGAAVLAGLAYAFFIHWSAIHTYRWSSDEPQHLHVVWAWTQGLVPYRDVFDNHTPLFSWLCSPLLRWVGECPDVVERMRPAMLPLFALSLWCIYRVGAALFSPRAGAWAAVFAALWPEWSVKMVEFRTDVLWTTLWLATLAVLLGGPLTWRRALCAGVLLGAAFCTSLKTVLLLANLLVAGGAVLVYRYRARSAPTSREVLGLAAAFVGGMVLLPAAWLLFFAAKGALPALHECLITHNLVPNPEKTIRHWKRAGWIVSILTLACLVPRGPVAWLVPERRLQGRTLFLLFLSISFYPLLRGLWTMITPQDYLPYSPVPVLGLAFLAATLLPRLAPWRFVSTVVLLGIGAKLAVAMSPKHAVGHLTNRERIEEMAAVLRLAKPGEYVMDAKGESIFRPRPYYYVIETFTRQRLALGLLPEILPARLAETHTAIVFGTLLVPKLSRAFLAENYLDIGPLSVAGKLLERPFAEPHLSVEVRIPQSYRVVSDRPGLAGTIDGLPLADAHWLEAGRHEIELTKSEGRLALVWSRAIEDGWSPFPREP